MQGSYDFYITPEEYEQARKNGVRPALLEVRVRSLAWLKERAINTPPHVKHRLGRQWIELAEKNGICYKTLNYRVNQLGWPIERAATQPLQDRVKQARRAMEASRRYPVRYLELARRNGIGYDTFRQRIYAGWPIEKAATQPPMTPREIGLMTKEKTQGSLSACFLKNLKVRR